MSQPDQEPKPIPPSLEVEAHELGAWLDDLANGDPKELLADPQIRETVEVVRQLFPRYSSPEEFMSAYQEEVRFRREQGL